MRCRIWSYFLPEHPGEFSLEVPIGARWLAVRVGLERPELSALVCPEREKAPRLLLAEWVGQDTRATPDDRFVGAVQSGTGPWIHYFERCRRRAELGPCTCEPPCSR